MAKLMALELTEGSVSQMDGDEAFRHLLKVASILEGVK
jgi:glutamyl-tRNA reductase